MAVSQDYLRLYTTWTQLLDQKDSEAADKLYFQQILPAILPFIKVRSGNIPKYTRLISLLGFTPETVVLTSRLLKPSVLVVLHTPETEKFFDKVTAHCGLKSRQIHKISFLHDDEHINDIYVALKKALRYCSDTDRIAVELTGGKKTMSVQLSNAVAALRHRLGLSVDVVYIDYDEYLPQYRKPVPESSRLLIIQDPPASAYAVFGHVDDTEFESRQLLVNPIFHARNIPLQRNTAFVLMPFRESWSERIWGFIQKGCTMFGLQAKRADDLFGHDIMEDIWKGISQARVIIADLTTRNTNVFYELGIAHTLGKKCILLTQNISDLPFDFQRYRCIEYADNADGYNQLENGLARMFYNMGINTLTGSEQGNNIGEVSMKGEGDMIQNDIGRLTKHIEELKKSAYELSDRKTALINARAKLNKVTQRIEFDNYSEQITEITTTIEEQETQIYAKREELLSLILGESGKIELILSRAEENLSKLSTSQVDDVFSELVQLQGALEQKGLPVPTNLSEVKAIAAKEDATAEEKRAKIKLSLSLLGPKVEIEKDVSDPGVIDVWKKFWKKVKEIAFIEVF